MIERPQALTHLATAVRRAPVAALLGPRQCGKTTLARDFASARDAAYLDLESPQDAARLRNPELVLGDLEGLVVLDEIQVRPELFSVLRVLVDRPAPAATFLVLGSASPALVRNASESLAGRVEFVDLSGFNLTETGSENWRSLWTRGGFPRSYLADGDQDSFAWRDAFVRTFLERDIPQLGISVPSAALRRFWTMLAHLHGNTWNASQLAGSMGLSAKTVRSYLDILTGTYMVRQLQPWVANIAKRQVKAPKIYFRDSGLLHALLGLHDEPELLGHPKVGHSWEGFALEQVLQVLRPSEAYFWASHQGAELDLFLPQHGRRLGFEFKLNEAPRVTKSMRIAMDDLELDELLLVYPGEHRFALDEGVTALPLSYVPALRWQP